MKKPKNFWDRLSKNYDKAESISEVNKYKSISQIRKYLDINDVVLDFGCATGTIASVIAKDVKEVHGIDLSPKMIQIAQNRVIERKIENVFFTQSTIFDKRQKEDTFNMILSFSILHLLEDTNKTMERINKLLKPGGLFVSLTPCLGERKFMKSLFSLGTKIGIVPYIRCFRIHELEKAVVDSGFQLVENKSIANNPLEYFIIAKKL